MASRQEVFDHAFQSIKINQQDRIDYVPKKCSHPLDAIRQDFQSLFDYIHIIEDVTTKKNATNTLRIHILNYMKTLFDSNTKSFAALYHNRDVLKLHNHFHVNESTLNLLELILIPNTYTSGKSSKDPCMIFLGKGMSGLPFFGPKQDHLHSALHSTSNSNKKMPCNNSSIVISMHPNEFDSLPVTVRSDFMNYYSDTTSSVPNKDVYKFQMIQFFMALIHIGIHLRALKLPNLKHMHPFLNNVLFPYVRHLNDFSIKGIHYAYFMKLCYSFTIYDFVIKRWFSGNSTSRFEWNQLLDWNKQNTCSTDTLIKVLRLYSKDIIPCGFGERPIFYRFRNLKSKEVKRVGADSYCFIPVKTFLNYVKTEKEFMEKTILRALSRTSLPLPRYVYDALAESYSESHTDIRMQVLIVLEDNKEIMGIHRSVIDSKHFFTSDVILKLCAVKRSRKRSAACISAPVE